jgi:hypothetical protein
MFCRSLFVLLYFFFWPLCCLFLSIDLIDGVKRSPEVLGRPICLQFSSLLRWHQHVFNYLCLRRMQLLLCTLSNGMSIIPNERYCLFRNLRETNSNIETLLFGNDEININENYNIFNKVRAFCGPFTIILRGFNSFFL